MVMKLKIRKKLVEFLKNKDKTSVILTFFKINETSFNSLRVVLLLIHQYKSIYIYQIQKPEISLFIFVPVRINRGVKFSFLSPKNQKTNKYPVQKVEGLDDNPDQMCK